MTTTTTNGTSDDAQNVSKIVGNAPVRLDKVFPALLTVDQAVQRPLEAGRAQGIARRFDSAALGVITVSERHDGTMHVVDGQHRVHAAKISGRGDQEIDAKIYTGLTTQQEAALFLELNKTHVPTPIAKYALRLKAGEPTAAAIEKIISSWGWRVAGGALNGAIGAPATLDRIWAMDPNGDRGVLHQTIAAITKAWDNHRDAGTASILGGFGVFMNRYGQQVDVEALAKNVQRKWHNPQSLAAQAQQLRALEGGKLDAVMARILRAEYNKGRTSGAIGDPRES